MGKGQKLSQVGMNSITIGLFKYKLSCMRIGLELGKILFCYDFTKA